MAINSSQAPDAPITDLSGHALSQAIHARQVSCREVMQAYLQRIEAVNPKVNAIVSLQDAGGLLAQADGRDRQLARGESMGWMHGFPHAVKDTASAAGIAMTMGSPLMRHHVPQVDGLAVQRIRAAGCIVIGKTNVPEFGLGSHTFNEVFGRTCNAYDLGKTAGGSSGGAAVALATRMLPVADGSDMMGSLRNPAGWNNVFGFRPSQGRVPMWPAPDLFISQLGTEGPMARHVQDLGLLLGIQSGYSQNAPLSIAKYLDFTGTYEDFDPKKARIGWLGDLAGHLQMEPGILDVCEHALQKMQGLGCQVEPMALGISPEAVWQAGLVWRFAGNQVRFAPFLAKPGGRAQMKPEALWEFDQGLGLSASDLMAASVQRSAFYNQLLALFEHCDYLALPTAQVWPFDGGLRWPSHINGVQMDAYCRWMEVTTYATFAGLPCISVPAGFNDQGLPMGLQIMGRPQADTQVLALAAAYEKVAQEVVQRRPKDF